jgi:uncharacterized protein YbjT (DUF2867 family)
VTTVPNDKAILIAGATGQQGGAVVAALAGKGFELKAMTRKPESPAAKTLAARGVPIVSGDLDDPASLRQALAGMWGAFSVQNTREAGVEKEEEQGKRFATIAREAGIQHFVYSSVGSADRRPGIPHFENKWRIEETVRGLGFPSHVILRPVFFMENLLSPGFLNGNRLSAAIRPNTALQMIAVQDIGRYGALAFTDADRLKGREIDIAGDEATLPATAEILSAGLGRPIEFVPLPISEARKYSEDLAAMFEWFDRVGYDVDIAALERELGVRSTRLPAWAAQQRG